MKSFIVLALSSMALAQTMTVKKTVVQLATVTTDIGAQATCLSACAPTDIDCQASCVGVPHPGAAQMIGVTDCVAACDQGDGSAEATDAYTVCRDNCISSYIVLSGNGTTSASTSAGASSSTGISGSMSANVSISTHGPSSSATASGSATSTSSQGFAASTGVARVGAIGGSLGLVLAAVALL